MKLKIKMLKNLVSVLCAATIATSGVVTSVGAVEHEEINAILNNIDSCDSFIADLERIKESINEEKENEMKRLDNEIKNSEKLLKCLINLIADGEDHEADYNRVKRSIEDNKEKKKQTIDDSEREINDLDRQAKIKKREKDRLAKALDDLLKKQEKRFNKAIREVKNKFNSIIRGADYRSFALIKNDEVSKIKVMEQKIKKELNSLKDPANDMDKVNNLKNKVEKFDKAVKELAKKLAEEKKKPATKMNKETFEKLLAGDQDVNNYRVVRGKNFKINNTCGIHVLTTLKNVYDYMDGKQSGFVQGFQNVINNYLAKGGNTNRLYAPLEAGVLGQALGVTDFKGFLENNNIGMSELEFYELRDFREEAKQAGKSEQRLYDEYFNKLRNKVKSFLVKYMEGKEFAPIAILIDGHWSLLAQYDKNTNRVLILDSHPKEARWDDLDEIAKRVIYASTYSTGVSEFNIEMPIFTRTKGFKNMLVNSVEEFTDQRQNELINSIR